MQEHTNAPQGDRLANYLTMFGHLCSDINQGALSATLPFLVAGGYSYLQATTLVFAANIASAVIQPLFGWLGDRKPRPWLMAMGVTLAGVGMAAIGWALSYPLVVAAALVSGIGVAMFHPEGGRLTNLAAGSAKGEGMSVFAVGGNAGFFVGPVMVAAALSAFGLRGTAVFLVPALVCSCVLLVFNRRFLALGTATKGGAAATEEPERWDLFAAVMGVLSLRSVLSYGLGAFVPLFLTDAFGMEASAASVVISVQSLVGALATLSSGRISGRVGATRLMVACLAAAGVGTLAFTLTGSAAVAIACALAVSAANSLFYPSTVALGMEFVPGHLGMASGLSYGVAVAVGGAIEPGLGLIGDTMGLVPVMFVLAGTAAAGCCLALLLKGRLRNVHAYSHGNEQKGRQTIVA